MRKGRRKVWSALGMFLLGTIATAAQPEPFAGGGGKPLRMAVEVNWAVRAGGTDAPLALELTEGRVIEALAWPVGERDFGPGQGGRTRALIEAPLGASLKVQAGGQAILIPVLALLEGPQRTPPQAPVEISVERLAWDSLLVDLGQGDGMVAPGETVPVAVGYNILTPEPTEVAVRCTAELRPARGGEPIWRDERQAVVATNQRLPSAHVWNLAAPAVEGTYVLAVETRWEPVAGPEGSRLGRWIRRRWNPMTSTSSTRRLTLAVVGPTPAPPDSPTGPVEQELEAIDLTRMRGFRPVASGRSPLLAPGGADWPVPETALVEATRRDRLRGWITRSGSEAANLAPADPSGLAWSALGLKVAHPGRPHRLTLTIQGGHPAELGVALIDPASPGTGAGDRPRVVLDACANGPPILDGGPAASFSWLVWPDAAEPVVVLVNRNPSAPVRLGTVTLTELAEVPPGPRVLEPDPSARRTLGLYLADPKALDRFGFAGGESGPGDPLGLARNLGQYVASCGATAVVLPEWLADRSRRRSLEGQAAEDALGPDRLDLLLRILGRQGCSAWVELETEGTLPGLPDPGTPEALARGLTRVDREGRADGPAYHPLHPEVRAALKRRVAQVVAPRPGRPGLSGVLIRLGPGPTLLGGPDTGFDDSTYARFVRETFDPEVARGVPGLGSTDPDRFHAREKYLTGLGRMPWLTWRSRGIAALYAELAEAVAHAAPGARLAVATPGLEDSPAGREARRVDLAALSPSHAWRAVGLDLETWPTGDGAPVVLRGAGLSTDPLAHDLATSPELDALVAARTHRGLLLGVAAGDTPSGTTASGISPPSAPEPPGLAKPSGLLLSALPLSEGPEGDEPLGHAVAVLDARWVMLAMSAVAGHEERVRRFARIFRALPAASAAGDSPALDRQPFGVAVRAFPLGEQTYLSLANDTPYPIRLATVVNAPAAATVDDLGRGLRLKPEATPEGRHLVLDLLPFGVAALRVSAPRVQIGAVTPYPTAAVRTSMLARYNELSDQLARLTRGAADSRPGPPNPGFEPGDTRAVQLAIARNPASPGGWQLAGNPVNTTEIDLAQFHSGRGSLRLNAVAPPAAVVSDRFVPEARSSLTIQAWLRGDQPDARVRVWIEGEAAGRPFVRRSELTIQADWTAIAVRASDVPPGGLAWAQLRFELLTPGRLWVDDLSMAGETLSETERLNACRALLAALQAYRENRYADFARLAGSHWARLPAVTAPGGVGGPADRGGMIRTGGTTALPPDRRLR